jgi:hypothetical protein
MENLKRRGELRVEVSITPKWMLQLRCEGVDRIRLVQDRDQWSSLVNMEINFRVPKKSGRFLEQLTH